MRLHDYIYLKECLNDFLLPFSGQSHYHVIICCSLGIMRV